VCVCVLARVAYVYLCIVK